MARVAPQVAAEFERLESLTLEVVDPILVELLRLRMTQLLDDTSGSARRSAAALGRGLTPEKVTDLPSWPTSHHYSPVERACLGLAEQYVIDVSAVTEADTAPVLEHLGAAGLYGFVQVLWVIDESIRLDLALDAAFGNTPDAANSRRKIMTRNIRIPLPPGGTSPAAYQPDMSSALGEWSAACNRLNVLDPILLEVVRIRCARTHDCRLCKASRLKTAREEGLDEATLTTVDFYEESALPERLKTALRYTDIFLTQPASMSSRTPPRPTRRTSAKTRS